MVTVTNLETKEAHLYSCSPREAVIAAHAQDKNDFNTWDYAKRYGHMVQWAGSHVTCGNFTAVEASDG